jgi:hypothetical protein
MTNKQKGNDQGRNNTLIWHVFGSEAWFVTLVKDKTEVGVVCKTDSAVGKAHAGG